MGQIITRKKGEKRKGKESKLEAKLTGKPLCSFPRKIETTSATLTTRGKETTLNDSK